MSGMGMGLVSGFYEAIGRADLDGAAERLAEDVLVRNVATGDTYCGRSGFLEYERGWAAAFPDLRLGDLEVVQAGDRTIAEYVFAGTHTGPLVTPRGHLPATGMDVHIHFCDVVDSNAQTIRQIRSYFDSVTLLRQLGLLSGSPIHAPDRRASLELYAQPVESNAPHRHKAIVQRFVQEVFNRQNPGAVGDTCTRQYRWHGGALGEARTLTGYQHALATLFLAFPDFQLEVLDSVAEGDRVAIRFTMTGTHLGEFQGVPPTFRRVAGSGTNTYRLEDGRIVEEWWQGDTLALLQQMDAAPSTVPLTS